MDYQKTEDRKRKTEDRRQRSEDRDQNGRKKSKLVPLSGVWQMTNYDGMIKFIRNSSLITQHYKKLFLFLSSLKTGI